MRLISQILAFCLLLIILYGMGVFIFPDIFDRYGYSSMNIKIRSIKENIDKIGAPPRELTLWERMWIIRTGSEIYSGSKAVLEKWFSEGKKALENGGKILSGAKEFIDTQRGDIEDTINTLNETTDSVSEAIKSLHGVSESLRGKSEESQ